MRFSKLALTDPPADRPQPSDRPPNPFWNSRKVGNFREIPRGPAPPQKNHERRPGREATFRTPERTGSPPPEPEGTAGGPLPKDHEKGGRFQRSGPGGSSPGQGSEPRKRDRSGKNHGTPGGSRGSQKDRESSEGVGLKKPSNALRGPAAKDRAWKRPRDGGRRLSWFFAVRDRPWRPKVGEARGDHRSEGAGGRRKNRKQGAEREGEKSGEEVREAGPKP